LVVLHHLNAVEKLRQQRKTLMTFPRNFDSTIPVPMLTGQGYIFVFIFSRENIDETSCRPNK
jgi:hypothetical protein